MSTNSRGLAATTLLKVIKHTCPLDLALDDTFKHIDKQNERSFIQELCFGVMRWYPRLDFIVGKLLDKPLKQKDVDIKLLLLLGIYQLDMMRTPDHAAISATVDACNKLKKSWAKQLVNAVLRRYQREKTQLENQVNANASALYAHPDWFIEKLKEEWPRDWSALLEKNNEYPPMHLRINLHQGTRDDYLDELAKSNIHAKPCHLTDCGIILSAPLAVELIPGFSTGRVSVQDQGAQLAAKLLDLSPGLDVLDACAAPGGKCAHMYESEPELGKLLAIDQGKQRIALLKSTRQRLGIDMAIIDADAGDIESWWDGVLFDRILLDAPCSATGVIRRHPDIKMLRQHGQLSSLGQTQSRLLARLWPLLKRGGRMVYSTCSIFQQENDAQIEKLIREQDDVQLITINDHWGVATEYGRQTLPIQDDSDGFYYAVLEKGHV